LGGRAVVDSDPSPGRIAQSSAPAVPVADARIRSRDVVAFTQCLVAFDVAPEITLERVLRLRGPKDE